MPTGMVHAIAVVFHPFGAKGFIDLPINELSNLIVSADDFYLGSLKGMEDKIRHATDNRVYIGLIESFLIDRLNPLKEYYYKRMVKAVSSVNRCNEELSVSHLAETVCLSRKLFQRIFSRHVGITPKEFMRIVRFHKVLYRLQNNAAVSFTTLAYECGYYDRALMTNEFKLFSGYTPSQSIAICATDSDYFSTEVALSPILPTCNTLSLQSQ